MNTKVQVYAKFHVKSSKIKYFIPIEAVWDLVTHSLALAVIVAHYITLVDVEMT